MAALAMLALLAMTGFALDIGMVVLSCQRCQVIADAGVLAGSQELRDASLAVTVADRFAHQNIPTDAVEAYQVAVTHYAEGEEVPGLGTATGGDVLGVTVSKDVPYSFLRVLGTSGTTVTRSAYSTNVVTGTCILPIWIWHTTPVSYGDPINLLMADAPHCGIPGSFGFLQPADGVDYQSLLKGIITAEEEELQRVNIGDTVWANTGLAIDHWRGPLKNDTDSRLNRAAGYPWADDTFDSFHGNNPRILIIPMVEYVDGTGNGAHFIIRDFAAFWLEDVITLGTGRQIVGRFIDFANPGGTRYGMKPTHLIR